MVPRRGGASAHPPNNNTFLKICPQQKPAGARDDDSDDNNDDAGGDDDDNDNTKQQQQLILTVRNPGWVAVTELSEEATIHNSLTQPPQKSRTQQLWENTSTSRRTQQNNTLIDPRIAD